LEPLFYWDEVSIKKFLLLIAILIGVFSLALIFFGFQMTDFMSLMQANLSCGVNFNEWNFSNASWSGFK